MILDDFLSQNALVQEGKRKTFIIYFMISYILFFHLLMAPFFLETLGWEILSTILYLIWGIAVSLFSIGTSGVGFIVLGMIWLLVEWIQRMMYTYLPFPSVWYESDFYYWVSFTWAGMLLFLPLGILISIAVWRGYLEAEKEKQVID